MIKKYRKKPVTIEAMQFINTPECVEALKAFCPDMQYHEKARRPDPKAIVIVTTLEGNMVGNEGDYIIKGIAGEFYPCKPDIFQATYEQIFD